MIQRIQSVYLLLAAICIGIVFGAPLAESSKTEHVFMADATYTSSDHVGLVVAIAISFLVVFINIFLFRNRPLQIKMGYTGALLTLALPMIAFFLYYSEASTEIQYDTLTVDWGTYLFIPAFIFIILAIQNIRKDQKIVRSMDRLR